jgi:peptide/nickel transport system substrate-binding protein
MQAPGWYQKASDRERATSNVGYGPLKHVEYRIGEVWKAERYDGYVPVPGLAEGQKPAIREVTWVFRAETAVRLAMLQTGEADLALRLDIDDADKMPAFVIGAEGSIIGFRADMLWNPVLAKKEIRQALAYAIDCPTMAKTFYRGYAECVGVPAPLGVLGVTEKNVKPLYDYNPAKARELLAKAGYKGEEVRLRMREGRFPKDVEVSEAIVSSWREVGINAKLVVMESSKWLELHTTGPGAFKKEDWPRLSQLPPPKPGLVSPDLLLAAPGNDTLDFGRNLAFYLDCRSTRSKICDPNLQLKVEAALAASGEERKRQIAAVMDTLREELYMHSLFDAPFLWGTQKDLVFEPAVGGRRIQINTIRWK